MAYPEEIIAALAVRFELLAPQQQQLRNCLMVNGVQTAIEERGLNPQDLIIQLNIPGATHVSVLSTIAAQQIVIEPRLLAALHSFARANPSAWIEWDQIKNKIQALGNLSWSQIRERKQLAIKMYFQAAKIPATHSIIMQNPIIQSEYLSLLDSLARYTNALTEPLEEAAIIYFTALFKQQSKRIIATPTFRPKGLGVQLGRIMAINYADSVGRSHRIEYFIKTHQHGSTSGASSVKPVDPKEIAVYKILEYIGYGPKVHFFYNPIAATPGGFFIATQDAGFTKISDKNKTFKVFSHILGTYEATYAQTEHDSARRNIIVIDMLSRILRLSDTVTNPDNYGRVTVNSERTKWKLLDFRIHSEPDISYLRTEIFNDFCIGNGVSNYDAQNFFRDIFRDQTTTTRKFAMAREIAQEFRVGKACQSRDAKKMPLLAAMTKAHSEVQEYIKQHHQQLRLDLNKKLWDLDQYFAAVQTNFTLLAEEI